MSRSTIAILLAALCLGLLFLSFAVMRGETIEHELEQAVEQRLLAEGYSQIEVVADGQHVTLRGVVGSDAARRFALGIAAQDDKLVGDGVVGIVDELEIGRRDQATGQSKSFAAGREVAPTAGAQPAEPGPATPSFRTPLVPSQFRQESNDAGTAAEMPAAQARFALVLEREPFAVRGNVDSENTRNDILGALEMLFGSVPDGELGATAPELLQWRSILTLSLPQFARLAHGTLTLRQGELALTGQVRAVQDLAAIEAALATASRYGVVARTDLVGAPQDLAACQDGFNALLQEEAIRFEVGSADLDPTSAELLDRLAVVARHCDFDIIIAGHTDSDGAAEANLSLSEDRASAVVQYLIGRDIDRNRLTAQGYGESVPVADNNSAEGRFLNRRIEFTVLDLSTSSTDASSDAAAGARE